MSENESDRACAPTPGRRIMIVEDDPIVAEHFSDIVRSSCQLELVAVAPSIAAARTQVVLAPHLVLLDVGLPDGSGLNLISELKAQQDTLVLMVTTFGDRETVVAALCAGADGYLLKDSNAATILAGIEATLAGGAPVSPAAAVYLLDSLRGPPSASVEPQCGPSYLTPREIDLLKHFASGASYKEAARALGISPLTVGNHVKSIYRKLAVNSRGEAVYSAMRSGQLKV